MGVYDYIRCKYPLPAGVPDRLYQTKDTPSQFCDHYEIREDGSLWAEEYDTEDRSDPNAEGIAALRGCMTKVNVRWVPQPDFTGEVRFYGFGDDQSGEGWIELSAYFVRGQIRHLELLENSHPTEAAQ